jgi:DNA modification methylase
MKTNKEGEQFCGGCGSWYGVLGNEKTVDRYIQNSLIVFHKMGKVLRDDGTIWYNIGDCHKNGRLRMIPERLALALEEDGWVVADKIVWAKGASYNEKMMDTYDAEGKKAKILFQNPGSVMPSSANKRTNRSYEYVYVFAKNTKFYYDKYAVKEVGTFPAGTRAAKGSAERHDQEKVNARPAEYKVYDGTRQLRSVWFIPIERISGKYKHYATFPIKLPDTCIKAATSEFGACASCGAPYRRVVKPTEEYAKLLGKDWSDPEKDNAEGRGHYKHADGRTAGTRPTKRGVKSVSAGYETVGWEPTCQCMSDEIRPCIVMDPMNGVGATLVAAEELGRDSIGVDISSEYCETTIRRLKDVFGDSAIIKEEQQ